MTPPPGVANERTSLAWVRTALGLVVCALLVARVAMLRQSGWALVAALAAGLLAAAALAWSHDRYRRASVALAEDHRVDRALPALLLTLAVTLIGALSLLLIVLR